MGSRSRAECLRTKVIEFFEVNPGETLTADEIDARWPTCRAHRSRTMSALILSGHVQVIKRLIYSRALYGKGDGIKRGEPRARRPDRGAALHAAWHRKESK